MRKFMRCGLQTMAARVLVFTKTQPLRVEWYQCINWVTICCTQASNMT